MKLCGYSFSFMDFSETKGPFVFISFVKVVLWWVCYLEEGDSEHANTMFCHRALTLSSISPSALQSSVVLTGCYCPIDWQLRKPCQTPPLASTHRHLGRMSQAHWLSAGGSVSHWCSSRCLHALYSLMHFPQDGKKRIQRLAEEAKPINIKNQQGVHWH